MFEFATELRKLFILTLKRLLGNIATNPRENVIRLVTPGRKLSNYVPQNRVSYREYGGRKQITNTGC